jgi:dolichol-phosphate mannosyltransferase
MIKLAWDAITGFSYYPLQMAIYASFVLFLLSVLAIPFVAFLRLATGQVWFEGQATAIIIVLLVGSFQFFFFFVLGQYVARIYDEVRGRPLYIVADTFGFPRNDETNHRRRALESEEQRQIAPVNNETVGGRTQPKPSTGTGVLPSEVSGSD